MRIMCLIISLLTLGASAITPAWAEIKNTTEDKLCSFSINNKQLKKIYKERSTSQKTLFCFSKQSPENYGVFVVRFDSKSSGEGYCGAGNEDYIVLAKIQNKHAYPIDWNLIQSCINSKELYITDGDSFESLIAHLHNNKKELWISFEPLGPNTGKPDSSLQRLSIDKKRLKIVNGPDCSYHDNDISSCSNHEHSDKPSSTNNHN